jgi:hypothetical protein
MIMAVPIDVSQLQPDEWDRLQEAADRFENAWNQVNSMACGDALAPRDLSGVASTPQVDLAEFLPPREDPLRAITLQELIKTDLEIRWRRGETVKLESYMEHFPELGGTQAIAPALLYEEYRVRQRYGDQPPLATYEKRFPGQYGELERLVQEQPVPPLTLPSPSRDPARDIATPFDSQPSVRMGRSNSEVDEPPQASPTGTLRRSDPDLGELPIGVGYKLMQRLNRGAFGDVWRAEAPGGVEVAIKIIYGSVAEKQGQRELQALELIKHLRHPFLLPIHAYWQLEDRLIIAMELANGSLRDYAEKRRRTGERLPAQELLQYCREAAEALDYLHTRRVLHRDIKPENILVLEEHAKVADFDLARVVEQTRLLISASHCGTPAYTAPEVFWHGKVGPASDLYSLAVTYTELRLGRQLFPQRTWYQLMHDHLQRTPDLVPLPENEQRVLRQALAKEPGDRFPSCRKFIQALELTVPR